MNSLIALMIVAAIPAPTNGPRHPDAVEVFRCDFHRGWDKNHDKFPDGWSRKQGVKFPHYLEIKLEDEPAAIADGTDNTASGTGNTAGGTGNTAKDRRYLAIHLDGGAASVYSPPIEIGSEFSYVLEAQLRTEKLKFDRAFVTVTFYNADRKPLKTHYSRRYQNAAHWTKLRVGPFSPLTKEAVFAVIGLHVHPTSRADIHGAAMFDDIWFAHLPQMIIQTNSKHNIYSLSKTGKSDKVEITCSISGILERDPLITFELVDISHTNVDKSSRRLEGSIVQRQSSKISSLAGLRRNKSSGYAGVTRWSPTTVSPGFYRVRVTMAGRDGLMQKRDITFAVVRPEKPQLGGEFGWSLPGGDSIVPLDALPELLSRSAVNWVKFPVWHGQKETDRANKLVVFSEQLSDHGIRMVGLLDKPPLDVRKQFGDSDSLYAADVFTIDPKIWYGSLEPVMTRLSSSISWWQLGLDQDTSFVGYPDVVSKIRDVKRHLEKFGQRANLGIGGRWMYEMEQGSDLPWAYQQLSAKPSLTEKELDAYMDATKEVKFQRWITLEPLPRDQYTMEARAVDLVQRMMTAKIQGADGVFVPNPFSTEQGLMNDDGTPGELFLTWRTTALSLSGATYLGSVRLPSGSHNRIFSRGDDAVMVVWNEKPTREVIYLGENVRHVDIWGRHKKVNNEEHRQVIEVGPLPTFVMGVNEPITRMRMSFSFDKTRLPSIFGKPHPNSFKITNNFPQGAGGTISLITPKQWNKRPIETNFKLATNERLSQPFKIQLKNNASSGRHEMRVDFDINVDEHYQFSVYRHLDIGLGDVVISATTRLTDDGVLEVKQLMINKTDLFVDFKCYLMAPRERRQRNMVFRLGRGKNVQTFRYTRGRELIGKTLWLKAEEVDGARVLNFSFVAKP